MKVSVALVTYNSSKYLKNQIDSILVNLSEQDELVISDDGSADNTLDIIKQYMRLDDRIKLFTINHSGCNANYENAIKHCTMDLIVLSDDDNVWFDNKLNRIKEEFAKNDSLTLLMHDCKIVDQNLNEIEPSFLKYNNAKPGLFRNLLRSRFGGSLISFRRDFCKYILPFPKHISFFYDDWIGLMASKHGKVIFINDVLGVWRRYEGAQSTQFINVISQTKKSKRKKRIKTFIKRNFERIRVRVQKIWLLIIR